VGGEGAGSVLEGITLTGGSGFDPGEGIYIGSSSPTIRNCRIVANEVAVGNGGGVYCTGSSPVFENCQILQNHAGWYHAIGGNGAGIYADATSRPTLQDCILSGNAVMHGSGGGIYCKATDSTINGCAITGNRGGGVDGSDLQITNCVITGNDINGGIRCSRSTVTGCTISGNMGWPSGGGLLASDTQILRSIIWGNCRPEPLGPDEITSNGNVVLTCCAVGLAGVFGDVSFNGPQVYSDPLFCEPEVCTNVPTTAGDYRLDSSSPCLPPASPCGSLVGALPMGCGPAEVPVGGPDGAAPITQIYPNPARGPVTFRFHTVRVGQVSLGIYDVAGRLVRTALDHVLDPGAQSLEWDTRDQSGLRVPAGVYYFGLKMEGEGLVTRLVIVR
jgi:hypothetical protein